MTGTTEQLVEMPAMPEQLKVRWETADGQQRLVEVVKRSTEREDWALVLEGFPHTEEVENGRDLRKADLSGIDLSKADLDEANLVEALLSEGNFGSAGLRGADLTGADLTGADLTKADLVAADLSLSDLNGAELSGADLGEANLTQAHLSHAKCHEANFGDANLCRADLRAADLRGVNLRGADLSGADLSEADLRKADLRGADLSECALGGTDFSGADLTDVDIRGSRMTGAVFRDAVLTGAKLYGTSRDDWKIEDVECRYVHWDSNGIVRSPGNRELAAGEFEQLYESLPTIEYVFEDGMTPLDPLIMNAVVKAIRERMPEIDIKIDSINARGLAPSIKFTVPREDQKARTLDEVVREYNGRVALLEGRVSDLQRSFTAMLDKPNQFMLLVGGDTMFCSEKTTIGDGSTITEISAPVTADQVQIGTRNSQQTKAGPDVAVAIAEICRLVQDLMVQAKVSEAERSALRDQIEILKVETTSQQPKPTVLKACLGTIKTILLSAVGSGVAAAAIQHIDKVVALL